MRRKPFEKHKIPPMEKYVTIYCSHRKVCLKANCTCSPMEKLPVKENDKDNVAFIELRHCHGYRAKDEEGDTIKGQDIKEVGVWK